MFTLSTRPIISVWTKHIHLFVIQTISIQTEFNSIPFITGELYEDLNLDKYLGLGERLSLLPMNIHLWDDVKVIKCIIYKEDRKRLSWIWLNGSLICNSFIFIGMKNLKWLVIDERSLDLTVTPGGPTHPEFLHSFQISSYCQTKFR